MATGPPQLMGALGLAAVVLTGSSPAFGAEPDPPAIRILVMSHVGVPPPDILLQAQAETARIYAAIGVKLVWTDPSRALPLLTVKIVSEPILGTQNGVADAMGFAPGADEGTGRVAYASYGRIDASAQRHRTEVAKVLGHVIAHELGHILLARGAHSKAGIMNGRWNQFHMDLIAVSLLGFTNQQVKLIRSRVAEMNAHHARKLGVVVNNLRGWN